MVAFSAHYRALNKGRRDRKDASARIDKRDYLNIV